MASKKSLDFNGLLTKLSNIFPVDAYIIGFHYVIEGEKSKEKNCSTNTVLLDSNSTELCKEVFENNSIVYIENIKKAKENLSEYIKFIPESSEYIDKTIQDYLEKNINATKWQPFDRLTDDDIEMVLSNKEVLYEIEEGESIILSKSILPLITKTNIRDIFFRYEKFHMSENENQKDEILLFVIGCYYDYFQFYLNFTYLI